MSPRPLYAEAMERQDAQRLARAKFCEPDPSETYLERLKAEAKKKERAEKQAARKAARAAEKAAESEKRKAARKVRRAAAKKVSRAAAKEERARIRAASSLSELQQRQVEQDADAALRAIAAEPKLLSLRDGQSRARRSEWIRVLTLRFTDGEIARQLGVSVHTVADWRRAAGAQSPHFRVARTRRDEAQKLVAEGIPVADIAKRLGIDRGYVWHLLRRDTRVHLPGPRGTRCGFPFAPTVTDVGQATCGRCRLLHAQAGVPPEPHYVRWGTDALRLMVERATAELARRGATS